MKMPEDYNAFMLEEWQFQGFIGGLIIGFIFTSLLWMLKDSFK